MPIVPGELTFSSNRTIGPTGGGLGLATFLLGDVTQLPPLRQPEYRRARAAVAHVYYAQDTWRANDKLTLNYGLRLDIINPQTVNEAGNGGFLDLATGDIRVGGVGDIGLNGDIENRLNWAPRVGATYQINSKTVIRGGYGRSYDLGVFGSLFGHSVTQNLPVLSVQELNAPENFDARLHARARAAAAGLSRRSRRTAGSRCPMACSRAPFRRSSGRRRVDAFNVIAAAPVDRHHVGRGRLRRQPGQRTCSRATARRSTSTSPRSRGSALPQNNQRQPFFAGGVTTTSGLGGAFGWTQGIDFFCNCAQQRLRLAAGEVQQAVLHRLLGEGELHAAARRSRRAADYFFYDVEMNKGPADWDRTHNFVLSVVAEVPVGRGRTLHDGHVAGRWTRSSAAGSSTRTTIIQSGLPVQRQLPGCRRRPRHGGNNRPNLIGDPDGPQTRDQWFNATPIGSPGSAFSRPARGTFGNMESNSLRGPGYWRTDASLFKHFRVHRHRGRSSSASRPSICSTT